MRSLLASFIVMFCVVAFTAGPVLAKNERMRPNQPKLLNPATDRLVAMGLPQGETRVWMDEFIPDGNGGVIMALCLKDLISQRVFPAAGPVVGDSTFCLADIVPVFFPVQFTATAIVSTGVGRGPHPRQRNKIPARKVVVCTIFVEYERSTRALPLLHTIVCPGPAARGMISGSFLTPAVAEGEPVASFDSGDINQNFDDTEYD